MPENIADLIDQFIKHVGAYMAYAGLKRTCLAMVARGNLAAATGALEHDKVSNEARNHVLRIGRELATQLEANDHDSTSLFKFLNAVDGGGGPTVAVVFWSDLKAGLLRIATRWRAGLAESRAPAKRKRPIHPKLQETLDYIKGHPGLSGPEIAPECGISVEHFYRIASEKLPALGVSNDGSSGYIYSPPEPA